MQKRNIFVWILVVLVASVSLVFICRGCLKSQKAGDDEAVLGGFSAENSEALLQKKPLPIDVVIPEGAGHIVESYKADVPEEIQKVVVHIQDIHTNYEAQMNLCKIIEALIKQNQLKLVMVEGGWGNVSLSYLRAYADKERRLEVAEEYLREGKISGEEYLDITSDYEILLEGIEEEVLYRQNLDAFFKIEEFRHKAGKELNLLKDVVSSIKKKSYPPKLVELEKAKDKYDKEESSLADYYRKIDYYANKVSILLTDYSNFCDFIKITEAEKEIDFAEVEKERSRLIEKISKKLAKQDLAELVTKSLEFKLNKYTPAEYHNYLLAQAQKVSEPLEEYPQLNKYVAYVSSHESIDTVKLFEEAEELFNLVGDELLSNPRQKSLKDISRSVDVLDNFLNLKLVPKDFEYYKEHKDNFITANWIDFLNGEKERLKVRGVKAVPAITVDANLSTLVMFYDIANKRDNVFVDNTIKLMDENFAKVSVLIAGGFHTPALTEKFKEHDISYIVVAPHTTEETDPDLYRYILKYKAGKVEEGEGVE
ncbi:MAG: hypothetical protein ABIB11_05145 [Candidatus Omnitrophota bacterium]